MPDLISLEAFGRLRLRQFTPAHLEVHEIRDWEYMDDRWIGEGVGAFTEFLRLEENPDAVRAITLDLTQLPDVVSQAILAAVGLPLRPSMLDREVVAALGPPVTEHRFVEQRVTYEFACGSADEYQLWCTVDDAQGLVHVAVLGPTPRRLAGSALDRDA